MGYKKAVPQKSATKTPQDIQAAHWVPTSTEHGEVSVDQLTAKHRANAEAQNNSARATWTPSPSLSDKERKTLDGTLGRWKGRDAIGAPKSIASGLSPRGFKQSESVLESTAGASDAKDQPSQGPEPLMKVKR